jgi:endonuclease G
MNRKRALRASSIVFALVVLTVASWLLLTTRDGRIPEQAGRALETGLRDSATGIGLPFTPDPAGVLSYAGFTLKYNEEFEQAEWVAYELTDEEVRGSFDRSEDFRSDPRVLTGSADPDDYRGSGFDRGHLAPAGDMKWSDQAMSESFLMTNMSPQRPGFNRGIWRKLEEQVREWVEEDGELWVVTGPVLTDGPYQEIGDNEVAVPKRFYKVLLDYREPELKAVGFVLPNEAASLPLAAFAVTVDQVEGITGLDFFAALPDPIEERLESRLDLGLWGLGPAEGVPAGVGSGSLPGGSAAAPGQGGVP